jgi:hypothetical protein
MSSTPSQDLKIHDARPSFCHICNVRHSTLACPLINIEICWFRSCTGWEHHGIVTNNTVLSGLEILFSHQERSGAVFGCRNCHNLKVKSKTKRLERHNDMLWSSGRTNVTVFTRYSQLCVTECLAKQRYNKSVLDDIQVMHDPTSQLMRPT